MLRWLLNKLRRRQPLGDNWRAPYDVGMPTYYGPINWELLRQRAKK